MGGQESRPVRPANMPTCGPVTRSNARARRVDGDGQEDGPWPPESPPLSAEAQLTEEDGLQRTIPEGGDRAGGLEPAPGLSSEATQSPHDQSKAGPAAGKPTMRIGGAPGCGGRGGASTVPTNELPLTGAEAERVRREYTQIRGGMWVPGLGPWEKQQRDQNSGSEAINVLGYGNCLHNAFVEAADRDQIPQRRHKTGQQPFEAYKAAGRKFYRGQEFYQLRKRPDFSEHFLLLAPLAGSESNRPAEDKEIGAHFFTADRPASFAACQVMALALQVDIHIQNLAHLDENPMILRGGYPNDGQNRPEVHLLLRPEGLPMYDSNLVRIDGATDGHFYLVDRHLAEIGGQGDGQAGIPESSGNQTGSERFRP